MNESKKPPKYKDNPLNKRLRELVNTKDITALAEHLGVTAEAIRQWIGGYARPDIDRLADIATCFNTTIAFLFGETECKSPDNLTRIVCETYGLSERSLEIIKHNNGLGDLVSSLIILATSDSDHRVNEFIKLFGQLSMFNT